MHGDHTLNTPRHPALFWKIRVMVWSILFALGSAVQAQILPAGTPPEAVPTLSSPPATPATNAPSSLASNATHAALPANLPNWEQNLLDLVNQHARTLGTRYRFEVRVGQLNPKLKLAPCEALEPQIPENKRLWGKFQVSLKCTQGARWQVYVPVELKVFGPALTLTRTVEAGKPVSQQDVLEEERELTGLADQTPATIEDLPGKVSNRLLSARQVLTLTMLKGAPILTAGEDVKVTLIAPDFTIQGEGTAITTAQVGETIRVRMRNGRLVSGVAKDKALVEVKL